jgi:CHAD domain-containing protein
LVAHDVRSALEVERKLEGDPELLEALGGVAIEPRLFTSTYYDTEDRRLLSRGITLRRRVEDGRSLWQLKLPRATGRLEVEAAGGAKPPSEIHELLTAPLAGGELVPAATLRTRRSGVRVRRGSGSAEVTADDVAVLEDQREVDHFTELEVELIDGDDSLLDALTERLRQAGARQGAETPKLARALGVPPHLVPTEPDRDAPAVDHLVWQLHTQYERILLHDPGVRLGTDPEDVHQLRVATRRVRAMLRATRPLLAPEWSEPLRDELRWLAGELGPLRDADVLIEYLRGEAATLGAAEEAGARALVELVERERSDAHARAWSALRSGRYYTLLRELERTARAPRVRSADASLQEIAAGEFKKLRRTARKLSSDPSDEELHKLRIRGKRARYAAELAAPAVGKPAKRFLKAAKRFQDVVGEHQDAVVAEERVRDLHRRLGTEEAALAVGRLVERQHARRARARAALPGAWSKLEDAGDKAWR